MFGSFALQSTTAEAITKFTISLPIGSSSWWRGVNGNVSALVSDNPTVGIIEGILMTQV